MAEETLLKKQFQRLIRKCEKRHQEKLDQLFAADPAILDAYTPSTFGIDRSVLEEMWLMDNLIGKKFILQKLKTLYYEDKVNSTLSIHIYSAGLFFQRFWGRLEQPKAAPMLSFEGKSKFFAHFLVFSQIFIK